MAVDNNSATNNVPIFGCPGTVTVGAEGSARTWILTGITVTPGSDLAEVRDSNGMIVSRTHFNLDGSGNNRSTTISINAIPIGSDAAAALTTSALVDNGTTFVVASSTVAGANGTWETTSMTTTGSNTDHASLTLNGIWAVTN